MNSKIVKKNSNHHNQVRIIAGDFRRQLLKFPNAIDLRPTPDRVKETVFNWLGQYFKNNEICLDLFSGSGAMGAEAFSRQAQSVIFVEKNKTILNSLKDNLERIKMLPDKNSERKITFFAGDAFDYLKQSKLLFDVIFIDPPYRNREYLTELMPLLIQRLNSNGKIYLESDQKFILDESLLSQLEIIREDKAGMVNYCLLQKIL